jgi:DNA (cytosine-5)-methyltransferase 1
MLAIAILDQVFSIKPPFELPLLQHTEILSFRKRKKLQTQRYVKKATMALSRTSEFCRPAPAKLRRYRANISDTFDWKVTGGNLHVSCKISLKEWKFEVGDSYPKGQHAFMIESKPLTSWSLPVDRVMLVGYQLTPQVFMGLWKAFDAELRHLRIKADLVQLSGYYQYHPTFTSKFEFENQITPNDHWKVLCKVVAGLGTRKTMSSQQLASEWEINGEEIKKHAHWLRHLGYEVRNTNTNPQIPRGHYLIPYTFPTMTPQSVQLRKSLGENNA